jgi:hypothetical protein
MPAPQTPLNIRGDPGRRARIRLRSRNPALSAESLKYEAVESILRHDLKAAKVIALLEIRQID